MLAIRRKFWYIYKALSYGSLAQLGEHLPYKQRVIGSSPIIPTISAGVAQLVEHCLAKAVVAGPSPVSRSIIKGQHVKYPCCFFILSSQLVISLRFAVYCRFMLC